MNNTTPYAIYINEKELGLYPVVKNFPYSVEDDIATIEQDILYVSQHSVQYWATEIENNTRYIAGNNARTMEKQSIEQLCQILKNKQHKDIRWISLGAGTGYHDLEVYKIFNKNHIEILEYIAVDFSMNMLLTLLEVFENSRNIMKDSNKIKAIKTNFHHLSEDEKILNILNGNDSDINNCPTIFTIFGKTFGNSDEKLLLEELNKIMKKNDFLLIGAKLECANCHVEENEKEILTKFFDLSLKYLRHTMGTDDLKKLPLKKFFIDKSINMDMKYTSDEEGGKSVWIPYIGDKISDETIGKIKSAVELTRHVAKVIDPEIAAATNIAEYSVRKTLENVSGRKIKTLIFGKSTEYKKIYFDAFGNEKLKYSKDLSISNKSYICAVYEKIKK